jgi:dihydrofolate reductase
MLMGRKTYESIGKPLPGRTTFVMSRQSNLAIPGCTVVRSCQEALEQLPDQRLFVVGGAEIYRQLFPVCRAIHLTRVLAEISGDARLESIDLNGFRCTEQLYLPASAHDDWPTVYELWETTEPTIDS